MEWSGRAPAPPAIEAGKGRKDREHAMSEKPNNAIAVIGIDIGKKSFHVVGLDARGAIVRRQRWSRGHVEARFANMPPCLIGMKACVGAHHLSPKLQGLGHDARVMPANYVWPYSQKNDFEMRRRSPRRCSVCARSPPDALKRRVDTPALTPTHFANRV